MTSFPFISWKIEGEKVEEVTDFLFLGSKITADGDCRHEIRRQLLLGRKAMTNLHNMLKSKEMTLLTKLWIVKAIVFPVVMYGCESWTLKKAECQKIYAFDLWCWWRLLRVPWKARSNQPISKEINPEYSLEGLMLKLKLQYFGHLMRTADSLKKTLMLGVIEGRGWNGWMASPIQWTWSWARHRETVREAWHSAVYGVMKSCTWLGDWTTTLTQ